MPKYIESEALIKDFNRNSSYFVYGRRTVNFIISRINMQPAADVVEVVHGEWISEIGSYCTPRCSACGWHKPYTEDYYCAKELYSPWNYCPNCGAKMDERRGDNNG